MDIHWNLPSQNDPNSNVEWWGNLFCQSLFHCFMCLGWIQSSRPAYQRCAMVRQQNKNPKNTKQQNEKKWCVEVGWLQHPTSSHPNIAIARCTEVIVLVATSTNEMSYPSRASWLRH
jgi:hypothetical protein